MSLADPPTSHHGLRGRLRADEIALLLQGRLEIDDSDRDLLAMAMALTEVPDAWHVSGVVPIFEGLDRSSPDPNQSPFRASSPLL